MSLAMAPDGTRPSRVRQVLAVSVGNAVEWFDWYIYALLAVYFAPQFFPEAAAGSLVPLLGTLAIFALGFFARPFGGLVIGALADRVGRKWTMNLTITMMGAGSLVIAVAPTYEQVGVLAPIILLVARITQGISAGGEFAASTTMLIESAPSHRRGLYSSFYYVSATSAFLLAILTSFILASTLSADELTSWGWRLPFFAGACFALVALYIRVHASETLHAAVESGESQVAERPRLFEVLRAHPKESFLIVAMVAGPTLAFYVFTSFLPTYANITEGLDPAVGFKSGVIAFLWFLVLQPVFGYLSDVVGRKPLALFFGVGSTLGVVPLLSILSDTFSSLLVVQLVGVTFLAMFTSMVQAILVELFPARLRAAGIGFPYALAVALFGGTGPYVATLFADLGKPELFAYYLAALFLISTTSYAFMRETARRPLL